MGGNVRLTLSTRTAAGAPQRLALFAVAVGLGTAVGIAWGTSGGPDWTYWGFLQLFLDPRAQIAGLGVGVALGFLAGAVHVVRV
jgi:ABC-type transporter Mla maintaining outer membrane lipid asymmetry permease subunit MlaE